MKEQLKENLRYLVAYQVLGVLGAVLAHPDRYFLHGLPVYLLVTNCVAWSIQTHFGLAHRYGHFHCWRRRWQIAFGIPAVASGCLIGLFVASLILKLFYGKDLQSSFPILNIFRRTLPGALVVTVVIIGYHNFQERLQREALEQERQKSLRARAELAALQSKLNPHFLFNTLNSMLNLAHKEPDKLEEMILGLSDIYRQVLQLPGVERISLAEEFALARQYLAIEQVRLGERLRFAVDLPEELRAWQVPPLLIQPLVENAVLHGIAPKPGGGRLSVSASRQGDRVRVVVADDGVGFTPAAGSGGFGLHSVRERLRLIAGDGEALRVESTPGGGTTVSLELGHER